jgi:hypothetical protein
MQQLVLLYTFVLGMFRVLVKMGGVRFWAVGFFFGKNAFFSSFEQNILRADYEQYSSVSRYE